MRIITIEKSDIKFPEMLRNIYDCPKRLYVIGNMENLRKDCISIVGTRECSKYGKSEAIKLAYRYSSIGKVIVSGLAAGIDSYAHIGALKSKGRTIAVLATGLNRIYPQQNRNLALEILKNNGTIITEYSIHDRIERKNFERRNRIISGLSKNVIIVEAKEKSGSLITANYAIEQGRNVFAVPGNITSKNSIGTNKLIMNGAEAIW